MNEKKTVWQNGMLYGAYLGISFILLSLIYYALKFESSMLSSLITIIVIFVWISIGTKNHRASLGGFITYSGALGSSMVIILFAGVISAFFTYVFLAFIEPETIANSIIEMENQMIENGDDEKTITAAVKMYKKFATPGFFAFFAFLGHMLMGFLIALIASIFLKRKNPNPFAEIQDDQIIDSEIK
jgi:hypothetical protein